MEKQEQHPEEQEERSTADGLQKRRKDLVEYFRSYLRLTFEELRAASARETEDVRGPLLAMRLDEEEIRGWERFRDEFAPRAVHAAEVLVAAYESLLDHAESDLLMEHDSATRWRQFFRSPTVDFKDKREALAELRAMLSVERGIAEKRARITAAKALWEKESKDAMPREPEEREMPAERHGREKREEEQQLPMEEKNAQRNPLEQEDHAMDGREDDAAMEAALRALPLSLLPLYRAAAARGTEAVRALTQVMARRVHHEEQSAEQSRRRAGGRFVMLWRDESMEAPERTLERVQRMAQLGSAQPVVVPQGVSRGAQEEIVQHIHPILQSRAAGRRDSRSSD